MSKKKKQQRAEEDSLSEDEGDSSDYDEDENRHERRQNVLSSIDEQSLEESKVEEGLSLLKATVTKCLLEQKKMSLNMMR